MLQHHECKYIFFNSYVFDKIFESNEKQYSSEIDDSYLTKLHFNFKINVFLLCSFYHPSDLTTSQFELILILMFFCFKNIYFRQCHLIFCISGGSKWQCLFGGQCMRSRKVVRCEHTCQGTHCSGHIIVSLHMLSI